MTTYGPCKRITIRTVDAIVTITGSNMVATVTHSDDGSPPVDISDVYSQNGAADHATKTAERDDCLAELGSSCFGESFGRHDFSPEFHLQPSASSDIESDSVREEKLWQCPPDIPNPAVTNETTVDSEPSDTGPTTEECAYHNESEQGCTTPSSPISSQSSGSDYSDSESQQSKDSAELQPLGSKRKCSDREENGDSDDRRESLVVRKYMCSSVGEVGGDVGNSSTNTNSLDSRLQLQCTTSCGGNTTQRASRQLGSHTKVASHSCDTCGKTFTTAQSVARHTRVHTGEKPYSCNTCGKTFTSAQGLARHTRIHTGEKPYSCDTCGKTFPRSGQLSEHIRIHTGVKPYSCDTCGKTFTTSGNLSQHIHTHTREKPYSCNTCGKTFSTSRYLTKHARIHTGVYSCDTCGKTFPSSSKLSTHVRVHTGEKPYSCDTCGKTFTQSGSLSQHVHIHTREKPYSCDTCGKTFTQSEYLPQHVCSHAHVIPVTRPWPSFSQGV